MLKNPSGLRAESKTSPLSHCLHSSPAAAAGANRHPQVSRLHWLSQTQWCSWETWEFRSWKKRLSAWRQFCNICLRASVIWLRVPPIVIKTWNDQGKMTNFAYTEGLVANLHWGTRVERSQDKLKRRFNCFPRLLSCCVNVDVNAQLLENRGEGVKLRSRTMIPNFWPIDRKLR